ADLEGQEPARHQPVSLERPAAALPGDQPPAPSGLVGAVRRQRPARQSRLQPLAGDQVRRGLLAFGVALLVGLLIASAGGGDRGTYRVRAVFDNGSFLIPGEDVKIAGVKVG